MYDLTDEQEKEGFGLRVRCLCAKLTGDELCWLVLVQLDIS